MYYALGIEKLDSLRLKDFKQRAKFIENEFKEFGKKRKLGLGFDIEPIETKRK